MYPSLKAKAIDVSIDCNDNHEGKAVDRGEADVTCSRKRVLVQQQHQSILPASCLRASIATNATKAVICEPIPVDRVKRGHLGTCIATLLEKLFPIRGRIGGGIYLRMRACHHGWVGDVERNSR